MEDLAWLHVCILFKRFTGKPNVKVTLLLCKSLGSNSTTRTVGEEEREKEDLSDKSGFVQKNNAAR